MTEHPQAPPPPPPPEHSQEPSASAAPADQGPRHAAGGNGVAVAALVCGILAMVLFFAFPLAILLGLVGLILGIVGVRRARHPATGRKGMAVAGIITSVLGLVLGMVVLAGVVKVFNDPAMRDTFERLQQGEPPEEVLEDLQNELEQ